MAMLAGRKRDTRKGEMREVEMWLGIAVSLIDRPQSRVLRAGRGRTSLAWASAKEREGASQRDFFLFFFLDGSQNAICIGIQDSREGPREGSIASLNQSGHIILDNAPLPPAAATKRQIDCVRGIKSACVANRYKFNYNFLKKTSWTFCSARQMLLVDFCYMTKLEKV